MIKIIIIHFVIGLIGYFKYSKSNSSVWRDDDILICYKTKPPHFKNIKSSNDADALLSCGFCTYCESGGNGSHCKKYGVEYYGVGCLSKTICDDFDFSLDEVKGYSQ